MTDELLERVALLEAKEAMLGMLYAYGRALDDFDEAALRAVVSPDIEMRHEAVGEPMRSADAMVAALKASKSNLRAAQHFITNPAVRLLGPGRGVIRACIFAMHDMAGDAPARARLVPAGGTYEMHVALIDGAWRIERLDVEETWFDDRIALIYPGPAPGAA